MSKSKILILIVITVTLNQLYAQINVACVGNSITLGYRSTNPYPDQLGNLVGTGYSVSNLGHASTTILINGDDSYWLVPEYYYAVGRPRNIVVITFGTNATRPINWDYHSNDFENDYIELINKFKKWDINSHKTIFILGLPPPIYSDGGTWGVRNDVLKNEVIPKIKNIAKQTNATIADFNSKMLNHSEWFDIDGIHPNAQGDSVMAQIVYDTIIKATNIVPDQPTGLKAIPGNYFVQLVWNHNIETGINAYHMYRSENIGDVKTYKTSVSSYDTTWIDYGVQKNKLYYYSIVASDLFGNRSPHSATVTGGVIDQTPPSAPQNLFVIQEADTIKLSWMPNSEIDLFKYYIYRSTNISDLQEASNILATVFSPLNAYSDTNFVENTTYYYGTKAVDISNNQGPLSNTVNLKTKSRPISADTTIILYEDTPHFFDPSDFPFSDADNHSLEKIVFIDADHLDYFSYSGEDIDSAIICDDISQLMFTSNPDEFGSKYAAFAFRVIDSFGSMSADTNIVTINVAAVNDAPNIDSVSDIYIMEDSHNILLPVSGITTGSTNEMQNISIDVFANDPNLVNIPFIQYTTPEESGLITIDPIENVFGIIPMTIKVIDDGGTEYDGVNTVETYFNINIAPINDPPIFDLLDVIQITEDSEMTIELTGVYAGPWETGQQITMSVKSNDTNLLPHPGLEYISPESIARLTFTTIPNQFGSASISIAMIDDGGIEYGGIDSISYTIPVEITSINDKPSDFQITSPTGDSTLVINKYNYNQIFSFRWETSEDIENDDISYSIIFDEKLSELSRYNIYSTYTEYLLKDILAASDTISITNDIFKIIASDGELETIAKNSGMSIKVDGRSFAPAKLHLDQNFPNPFKSTTMIGFDLPKSDYISLSIYDLLGEEIVKLADKQKFERGYNTIAWKGLDKYNKAVPAGVYIMQIKTNTAKQHKKLLLIK